ncbi:MAG: xanthine dehydrogenase family protein subunit M [Elusimicrobiota bacterium]
MAIACEFEYFKPKTVEEALKLLARYGSRGRVLAGGTNLVGWLKDGLIAPEALVDIKGLKDLGKIALKDGVVFIGALVTFNELIASSLVKSKLPLLWEAARTVGSKGLRNRATMVGNICAAVPCCDAGPALLAYEAKVLVKAPEGGRRIPAGGWFLGPKKPALKDGELALGVEIPLPPKRQGGCYAKLGRYKGEDLAQASVAVLALPRNECRVAFGAVGPRPFRSRKIEALLSVKKPDASVIEKAKRLVDGEIRPITDVRASKEYRSHMVKVMLGRAVTAAVSRLAGKGPAYGESVL